jgi:hypothetical protein
MRFATTIERGGKTATGFAVPSEIVEGLASGKRPPVTVTIGGHTYRSTIAVMGGRFMIPLSAENRQAAGVAAGDKVEVDITRHRPEGARGPRRPRRGHRSRCGGAVVLGLALLQQALPHRAVGGGCQDVGDPRPSHPEVRDRPPRPQGLTPTPCSGTSLDWPSGEPLKSLVRTTGRPFGRSS